MVECDTIRVDFTASARAVERRSRWMGSVTFSAVNGLAERLHGIQLFRLSRVRDTKRKIVAGLLRPDSSDPDPVPEADSSKRQPKLKCSLHVISRFDLMI